MEKHEIEEVVKAYHERPEWDGELPDEVYCKYCYQDVQPEFGDGVIVCSECGYGLAQIDDLEKYGGYDAYKLHIEIDFARMCKYMDEIKSGKREPNGIDEFGEVPYICSICKAKQANVYYDNKKYCDTCSKPIREQITQRLKRQAINYTKTKKL